MISEGSCYDWSNDAENAGINIFIHETIIIIFQNIPVSIRNFFQKYQKISTPNS